MGKDVIIALDFSGADEVFSFLSRFGEQRPYVKIGMELFYAQGPSIVRELKERGHRVFLDLKLHDIPNTVKRAMQVLKNLGADMVNIHAAGTSKMIAAALEGLSGNGARPLLIAVTQLTSTSEEYMQRELLIDKTMEQTVMHYAKITKLVGGDGVVCSPLEARAVKNACGKDFITVTPGIRLPGDDLCDQSRVTTPAMAAKLGSDYIVVGRSVTAAKDPAAAYAECVKQFLG
jgi:orotidine-5'-phosphate decarboxylase